jgi:light-regulated signal transduction histidine kinase (bacteriophytochrome)
LSKADSRQALQAAPTPFLSGARTEKPPETGLFLSRWGREKKVSGREQDQQARGFERFARLDQSEQDKVPDVGLGLYIAMQIITQQGGRSWLESTPGKGTTFFFTLLFAPQH